MSTEANNTVANLADDDANNETQAHETAVTIEQTWTLEHFSCYVDTEEKLYSMPFYLGYDYPLFALALRPFGRDEPNKEHISLYLVCNGKPPIELSVNYQFSIVDKDGEHKNTQEYTYTFVEKSYNAHRQFIARSELLDPKNGLLLEDQLEIYCKITASFSWSSSGLTECFNAQKHPLKLNNVLSNGHHSDVVIAVDGVDIPAHKVILCGSSSVFERMFEYPDTQEAQEGKVTIEDVDVDTFQVLLEYLYTGQIPETAQLTEELLAASNKYLVEDLKFACQEHLSTTLTINSAAHLYLFADIHNAATLKVNCLHYILANTVKVMGTEGWKEMLKTRPELVDTILRHFALRAVEDKQLIEK